MFPLFRRNVHAGQCVIRRVTDEPDAIVPNSTTVRRIIYRRHRRRRRRTPPHPGCCYAYTVLNNTQNYWSMQYEI